MSSFENHFVDKLPHNDLKIDSLRGEATAGAIIRLNKIAKISRKKTEKSLKSIDSITYKVGASGICLKLRKISRQDKFKVEFFAISQYYNLSQSAQKQHKAILKYILTRKSFDFKEVDIALDTQDYIETKPHKQAKAYKGTIYKEFADAKLCVYNKFQKESQKGHKHHVKNGTIRYELTLKLTKNTQRAKPAKAPQQVKAPAYNPSNKKYKKLYKYKLKKRKYKNTRDFIRILNSS